MALVEDLAAPPLAAPTDTGALGVFWLKRLWSRALAVRQGRFAPASLHGRHLDHLVIYALGAGLEHTTTYLGRTAPGFAEFERWIVASTGGVAAERIARINAAVTGRGPPPDHRALDRRDRGKRAGARRYRPHLLA